MKIRYLFLGPPHWSFILGRLMREGCGAGGIFHCVAGVGSVTVCDVLLSLGDVRGGAGRCSLL